MLVQRSSRDTERTSPVLEERYEATDGFGRPVHYVVHHPNIRFLESDESQPAIVLANGWTAGKSIMGRTATWLASQGRTAIVFDHHREAQSIEHPEEHKMLTLAATVEEYCQERDEEGVEIIAHSEGGINSTMYAISDREAKTRRVKSLTQVSPAGYLDVSSSQLMFRVGREVASLFDLGHIRNIGRLAVDGRDISDYLSRNIGLSRLEIQAIARSNVLSAAIALYKDGLPGGIIGCEYDKIFPGRELQMLLAGQLPFALIEGANHSDFLNHGLVRAAVYGLHQDFSTVTTPPRAVA